MLRAGRRARPGRARRARLGRARRGRAARVRPRVTVLTTGDELLEPGEPMRPGGVRNSNAHRSPALVERAGAEVARRRDRRRRPRRHRRRRSSGALDGRRRRDLRRRLGRRARPRRARRSPSSASSRSSGASRCGPGRPTWFGVARRPGALVFGLPGNPVSAIVTFLLFVRPGVRRAARRRRARPPRARRRSSTATTRSRPGAPSAVRCRSSWATTAGTRRRPAPRARTCSPRCSAPTRWRSSPPSRGASRPASAVEIELLPPSVRLAWPRLHHDDAMESRAPVRDPARARRARLGRDRAAPRARRSPTRSPPLRASRAWPSCSRRCRCGWRSTASTPTTDAPIAPGDELALIPPVSGGAPAPAAVRASPASRSRSTRSRRAVGRPGAGAIVTFQGVTREVERLEYEAYGEMAEERIAAILARLRRAPRARGRRRRAPRRRGAAGRAERDRRGLGGPPRGGVRRRPRGDRPDQGRGADLEARGRGRGGASWVEGTAPPLEATSDDAHPPRRRRRGRMVDVGAKAETERRALAEARRADDAGDGGGGRARRRARRATCSAPRGSPASRPPSGPAS